MLDLNDGNKPGRAKPEVYFLPAIEIIQNGLPLFNDQRDFGRAMFAWRFKLEPKQVRFIECWTLGFSNEDAMAQAGISKDELDRDRPRIFDKLQVTNNRGVCAIAGQFGLGPTDWVRKC